MYAGKMTAKKNHWADCAAKEKVKRKKQPQKTA